MTPDLGVWGSAALCIPRNVPSDINTLVQYTCQAAPFELRARLYSCIKQPKEAIVFAVHKDFALCIGARLHIGNITNLLNEIIGFVT